MSNVNPQFKIGDDVIVVNDHGTWFNTSNLDHDTVLKVVETHDGDYCVDSVNLVISIDALRDYPEDFQLAPKQGEYATGGWLNGDQQLGLIGEDGCETIIPMTRIEREQTVRTEDIGQSDILGVYRPQLETRKVGKVRVELVDDGFPLAIRELAKLMTWAQEAKGYRDHDWQNLPNWEIALAAATSRHRTDFIKQRVVEGLDIDECVDPESGLLHKVHEAFGVLAQLELMLRNKSK